MATKSELQKKRSRRRQRGITLIELLVVLAILATIVGLVAMNVLPEAERSRARAAKIEVTQIEGALDQYRLDMLTYPTTDQGLEALVNVPSDAANSDQYRPGGYIRNGDLSDPWGRPYMYRSPGEHGAFDLYSYGADGEPGGEGNDADIGNWSEDE